MNVTCLQRDIFCCSSGIAFTYAIVFNFSFYVVFIVRDRKCIVVKILISAFVIRKRVICAVNIVVVRVRIFPLNAISFKDERSQFENRERRRTLETEKKARNDILKQDGAFQTFKQTPFFLHEACLYSRCSIFS